MALVVGLGCSVRLPAALPQNPEFCMPGSAQTPEQLARNAALLLKEPESTRRMAALLQQIIRDADPMRNPFRSTEQVALLRAKIAGTTDFAQLLDLKMQLILQVLQAGLPDEALKENEEILAQLRQYAPQDDKLLPQLLLMSALCYLRMGEQENCLINHNADSCLFPVQGRGVHTLQRGSRGAITMLMELLAKHPGDLQARWLLNIAYMTLGEYPAKVPPQWLIDPQRFASDYDIKHFPDVAAAVGLDIEGQAGGARLKPGILPSQLVPRWNQTSQFTQLDWNVDQIRFASG